MPTKYFPDFHEGSWINYSTGLGKRDALPEIKHIVNNGQLSAILHLIELKFVKVYKWKQQFSRHIPPLSSLHHGCLEHKLVVGSS